MQRSGNAEVGRAFGDTAYIGVWLSLARAPGSGPGGRRFESGSPDAGQKTNYPPA